MAEKDYYKILGVPKAASRDDIKRAYKKLAKQYHPDLNKEESSADKFKEINEAASILGDETKRQQYDRYGSEAFRAGGTGAGYRGYDFSGFSSAFDFEDIFENFFGGSSRGSRRGARKDRGADLRHDISISLEQAAKGFEEELRIKRRISCSDCEGKGGHGVKTCSACHGTGRVRQARQTPFGVFATTSTCSTCSGLGEVFSDSCKTCDATGVVMEEVELKVMIPAGVEDGVRLRVAGEGDAGLRGGSAGDLYVFVHVKEHKFFSRDADDLRINVPISFVQAALGHDIEVPTLFGKAKLKIPAGTQGGTVFRLRGKGLPRVQSSYVGDQFVTVEVEVPKKLSTKQKKALEQYASVGVDSLNPQKGLFEKIFNP